MTSLWRIDENGLSPVGASRLDREHDLQNWIEKDPGLIDPDLMIIGREVEAAAGRIDLLGIAGDGGLRLIELKRDRTPREIVAQVLDYASWVAKLTTRDVYEIAEKYGAARNLPRFAERFRETFDRPLLDRLNTNHGMIIVASSLDPSSSRIVEYLNETHGVAINTAFFNIFEDRGSRYLTADWLLDREVAAERSETRTKAPWTGIWYANIGDGGSRSWEDMRAHGFLAAGGGRFYSSRLSQLSIGDQVYAYQKKTGYAGLGMVTGEVMLASEFKVEGVSLFSLPLKQPNIAHDKDDPELAEYVVPIDWKRTFPLSEAKTFSGAFANQNIVCRLRDPATIDYLQKVFA